LYNVKIVSTPWQLFVNWYNNSATWQRVH
jgi:hypothetical protein